MKEFDFEKVPIVEIANGGDIESLSKEMEAKMTSFESEFDPENLSLDGASGFANKLQNINFM